MFIRLFTLLLALCLTACGGNDHKDHKDHSHKDHDHKDHAHKDHDHKDHADKDHDDDGSHVHTAPHGGTLIELGDHAANVELKIDADLKTFVLWTLDAHAENAVKIAQPEVEITILASMATGTKEKMEDFTIALKAKANENTGEKVGDTSQFEIAADALKGLTAFDGVIKSVTIRGATYKDVKFSFKAK